MKPEKMSPERARRIEEIYHAALQRESAHRPAFLAEACGGDDALLKEVSSLIAAHERAGNFLEGSPDRIAAQMLDIEPAQSLVGRRIGRYEFRYLLGQGGMGQVYRARDTVLDREVAIKILPRHLSGNEDALARFKVEAKAVAALSHPNVLAIYDFGTEQGVTFAVMELLSGETLRSHLARSRLDWRKTVEYGLAFAEGLAAAHGKGIFHRDLKPENIFLTQDGQLKILDFGLARIKREAITQDALATASKELVTQPGVVMGTVGYMSPEQVRGDIAEAPSDVFSFGCVLYEMVTGRRAFARSTTQDTMAAILRDDAPPLEESGQIVPTPLAQLITRCLEKKSENRYSSASELIADLKAAGDTQKTERLPSRVGGGLRPAVWVGIISAVAIALLAAALWRRPASDPGSWPAHPLSLLPGNEDSPNLSPDGNFVAFSWSGSEKEGPGDIYIKAVGSEGLRQLTNTAFHENFPAWSPDGVQIAFVRAGQGVFVISQLGSAERKVSDSGSYVRWTPDNKSVVIRDSIGGGRFGVFQISLATLERRPIPLGTSVSVTRFDVSPDGKTLAFLGAPRPGVNDAYVVSMAGGEAERRTNQNAPAGGLIWTPDGRELILNSGYGYPLFLWRVPAFGSRPERGVPIAVSSPANSPTISRPASGGPARLAFLSVQADISLRLIDLNVPRPDGLIQAVQPLLDTTLVDYPGSFSQDANKIAFVSTRSGEPPPGLRFPNFVQEQMWVANRDGSGLRQLTRLDAPEKGAPAWSPDGKWIAFEVPIDGNTDIHIINTEGGEPRRLTTEPSTERFPGWSRDGSRIYFNSDRTGRSEIWKISAAGGAASQVTRNGGQEPIESVDGALIYYLQPGSDNLKQIPVAGGEETVVTKGLRPNHWAVTEMGIFFITRGEPGDALELYNPSDGKVTRYGRLPFQVSRVGSLGRFTVSRDGRWGLSLQTERWAMDLMLVDNFR